VCSPQRDEPATRPHDREKNVTTRARLTVLTALLGLFASPVHAQRSGFIIGFGLGPGAYTETRNVAQYGIEDRVSKIGVAMDFHIGGVVGRSVELYLMNHALLEGTGGERSGIATTTLVGLGVAYPLSPRLLIKGALGPAMQTLYYADVELASWNGLGLLAGGRYAFGDRWALDLDIMTAGHASGTYGGGPSEEGRWWSAGLTINVLSH
jgi:hypothetical protein